MFRVKVTSSFSAAHFLEQYHGKCEHLHGHNYQVWVHAQGRKLDDGGMLFDFGILKKGLKNVLSVLDHSLLNEIPFFADGNPSAERIAYYIYLEMKKKLPDAPVSLVEVSETEKNIASYLPDDLS